MWCRLVCIFRFYGGAHALRGAGCEAVRLAAPRLKLENRAPIWGWRAGKAYWCSRICSGIGRKPAIHAPQLGGRLGGENRQGTSGGKKGCPWRLVSDAGWSVMRAVQVWGRKLRRGRWQDRRPKWLQACPASARCAVAAQGKKGWAGRSTGAVASRTSPLMNSQGHPLVSLQMCATKNAPGRGVSLSVTAP